MIIGIGIDIVEIERIEKAIQMPAFVARVFTKNERAYCDGRGRQRAASYAARFAAKEAVLKALGTGFSGGSWQDIEILSRPGGQPYLILHGYFAATAARMHVRETYISLTHAQMYAAAQAVLWGDGK